MTNKSAEEMAIEMNICISGTVRKINSYFMEEFRKKDSGHARLVFIGAMSAPLTFVMCILRKMHESGIDPAKEFPEVLEAQVNLLRILAPLKDQWGKIPFEEFEDKVTKAFKEAGHYVEEHYL